MIILKTFVSISSILLVSTILHNFITTVSPCKASALRHEARSGDVGLGAGAAAVGPQALLHFRPALVNNVSESPQY